LAISSAELVPDARSAAMIDRGIAVFADNAPAFFTLLAVTFLVWAVLLVIDVAAQGGLTSEGRRVLAGEGASFGRGLSFGMKRWWRTAVVMALPALPGLVYLLVVVIVLWAQLVRPLASGAPPDLAALGALANALSAISPLSYLSSLLAIPLGVWAMLALRFGLVDDLAWARAFGAAWALVRHRFVDVLLITLIIYAIAYAAALVIGIMGTVLAAGFAFVVVSVATSGAASTAWLIGGAGILVLGVVLAAWSLAFSVYYSLVWTAFWVRAKEPGSAEAVIAAPASAGTHSTPASVPSASSEEGSRS
jgi:hypothetical protein